MPDRTLRILVAHYERLSVDSGATGTTHLLAAALRKRGHDVRVLFGEDIGMPAVHPVVRRLVLAPFLIWKKVREVLAEETRDVVVFSSPADWLAIGRLSRWREKPVTVYHSHGLWNRRCACVGPSKRVFTRLATTVECRQERQAMRKAAGCIVMCKKEAATASLILDRGHPLAVVPCGLDPSFLGEGERERPATRRDICFVAGWSAHKGCDWFLLALERLATEGCFPSVTFLSGDNRSWLRIPEALRPEQVKWLNTVAHAGMARFYKEHKLLVTPTLYEGFGRAIIEAMASGLGVISTDEGCASDYILDGVNGVLVPKRDAVRIAAAIRYLLENPIVLNGLGKAAAESVKGLTWDHVAQRHTLMYQELMEAKGK